MLCRKVIKTKVKRLLSYDRTNKQTDKQRLQLYIYIYKYQNKIYPNKYIKIRQIKISK